MTPKTPRKRVGRPAREYSQARRLLELYDMLQYGHSVKAAKEAPTFGTTERTIERDINCLREVLRGRLEKALSQYPIRVAT